MDDTALEVSRKKLSALDRQLSDLAVRQRTTEARLQQEHQLVRQSAGQRAVLVSKLVDSGEEESRKLHKAIDGMDAQIKSSERLAESYQSALKDIANETAATTAARDKLNAVVAGENTSRAFAQWQSEMEQNFKAARESMAAAREALGRLTTEAARGVERFAAPAGGWSAERFDRFEHEQANPNLIGFRQSLPWFRNVVIHVSPMTRG